MDTQSIKSMVHSLAAERIDAYLFERRLAPQPRTSLSARTHPVITISCESGVPGKDIAERVARALGFQIFDREILQTLQKDTLLGDRIIEALDTGKRSYLDAWIEGLIEFEHQIVGPKSYRYMVSRVIRGISLHGSAVILDHGAGFVLRGTNAFRVLLIAPLDVRIQVFIAGAQGKQPLSVTAARSEVERQDEEKCRFIRRHFRSDWKDPHAYDAIFNLQKLDRDLVAGLVVDSYRHVTGPVEPD